MFVGKILPGRAKELYTSFNPIWTGLFANLKRLGGPFCPPPPPYLGYFRSDDDETW